MRLAMLDERCLAIANLPLALAQLPTAAHPDAKDCFGVIPKPARETRRLSGPKISAIRPSVAGIALVRIRD